MKIYKLTWRGHEDTADWYFLVPPSLSRSRWRKVCEAAMEDAARRLLADTPQEDVISWADIAADAAEHLAKDYKRMVMREYTVTGGCPLPDHPHRYVPFELFERLTSHNARAEAMEEVV